MSEKNYFEILQSVNCKDHVEQKGGLSYLSWPFAVAELKRRHPTATWTVRHYQQPDNDFSSGVPYCITPAGAFVCVEVTVDGVQHEQIHPVLDNKNKTVRDPDAFQINTSIMRCLVKCIALHGLGLYIYAGEDLPIEGADSSVEQDAKQAGWIERINAAAPDALDVLRVELISAYGSAKQVPVALIALFKERVAARDAEAGK